MLLTRQGIDARDSLLTVKRYCDRVLHLNMYSPSLQELRDAVEHELGGAA